MGIIIAKFRKKKSTIEVLEKLENEIKSIDQFKRSTEESQKKIIRRFLVFAGLIYIIILALLYFNFNHFTFNEKLLCLVPLLVLPILIWSMKGILTWYYNKKIKKNQNKLIKLKDEKKKIIDNVMETETYKVAKIILDKFAPEPKKQLELTPMRALTPAGPLARNLNESGLRQRYVPQARGRLSMGNPITPLAPTRTEIIPSSLLRNKPPMVKSATIDGSMGLVPGTPLPRPRAVLPRDRSVLDKMVDYLVGDGPSNRFALICKECNGHNGMALSEEFEYLSFKCCYCSTFNPARKKKPSAPKLETSRVRSSIPASSDTSDSEKNSDSDSDSSVETKKPIITEPEEDKSTDADEEKKVSDLNSSPMDVDENVSNNQVTGD